MDPLVKLEDLMNRNFPQEEWLVDRILPEEAITILSGPPASYKTWVLLDIAIAVSSHKPLFGKFKTSQAGVLIIDEENNPRILQKRLFMLQATADLPIYFSNSPGFKLNDENVDLAILNCQAYGIKLVIIDSLVRIHASDENSAGDMAAVFDHLKRFTVKGITVLVTHHNRKPGANRSYTGSEMRGSSDILAAVDSHLALSRKDRQLVFHQTKQRGEEELEPFQIVANIDKYSFAFEYQGKLEVREDKVQAIQNAIVMLLTDNGKLMQKELLALLEDTGVKTNEHKLRTVLGAMVAEGVLQETAGSGKTKLYSLREVTPNE